MLRPFLFATSLAITLSATALSAQSSGPCSAAEPYGALDFWVGEWRVVDADGALVGTSRVDKVQAGCLIEESWSSARGGGGRSMNYYDPAAGLWRQHWVDGRGTVVHYSGSASDGVLQHEGQHISADGTISMIRATLRPVGEGKLHHLIEHSTDGGGTWITYFDATYVPMGGQIASTEAPDAGDAETSASATPDSAVDTAAAEVEAGVADVAEARESEVADSTQTREPAQEQAMRQAREEGSGVTAVSRALAREEIPEEQAPELRMASPMVLEITPGPVDVLPDNTAWQTDETKGFVCNDILIKKVTVARRHKGESVELEVSARVYTDKRMRRADLLIEILQGDQIIASEELRKIRVGINIPAHGTEGLWVSAKMSVSRQQFDALFAEGADRTVRLTLTVP